MDAVRAACVLQNEKACVLKNIEGCDRECYACNLVLPDVEILQAYDFAIEYLRNRED